MVINSFDADLKLRIEEKIFITSTVVTNSYSEYRAEVRKLTNSLR